MQVVPKSSIVLLLAFTLCTLSACTKNIRVSESGYGAFEADIDVMNDNTVVIAWYDTRHQRGEIYLRLLDPQLNPVSPEYRLTESEADSYEADVVALGDDIAVTWYEVDSAKHSSVKLGLWNRQGEQLWLKTLSDNSVNARIPVLERTGDSLFVAWLETDLAAVSEISSASTSSTRIVGSRIDRDGVDESAPFTIAAASETTWNLNLDIGSGSSADSIFLTYDAEFETAASELYLVQLTGSNIWVNRITDDDGYVSKYPDIAVRNDKAALSWFDNLFGNNEIYLAIRSIDDLLSPRLMDRFELGATRVSNGEGDSIGAYLAWNGDSLCLAWSDNSSGQHEVYFQHFAIAGNSISRIQRLTTSVADSLIPSIEVLDSGFVMAWNEVHINAHGSDENLSRSEIAVSRVQ